MSGTLQRLRPGRPIGWRTILGLLLVPLTAAGVLLWGLWNPSDRLDTMTAAVVNLDEPVEVDGQLTPLGRVLAGELVGGGGGSGGESGEAASDAGFTWVLTDESDAAAGLDDGRYTAIVTIPENFSAAATSFARAAGGSDGAAAEDAAATAAAPAEAERAVIDVATSERGRLLDAALSNIVVTTATSVLNEQLGSRFVGGVLVGMSELGAGIGEAADGAGELADGVSRLAGGADALAGGVTQFSGGVSELASGAAGLAGGTSELATGARAAAGGSAALAQGVRDYTDGVNSAVSGLQAGAGQAIAPLQQLYALIEADAVPLPPGQSKDEALAQLAQVIAGLQSASVDGPGNPLTQLKDGGSALAGGAQASAEGSAQLATGAEGVAAGASQLAGGAASLATGAAELSSGASGLASGTREASGGASALADGLVEAADRVPSYTESEAQSLAETAVQPVEARGSSDELFSASGVPLFAGLALWAGAFASFLVLAPLWRRSGEAARGVGAIALRSALPAAAIGAAQGLIAGLVLPPLLGYDAPQWFGFLGLAVLAGVSFSLLCQGLSALLGGLGRFLAFALLIVAFAVGVVSTAPPLLRAVGDASPIGALFSGFQSVAMGSAGAGSAVWALVLWGLGGLALTALAVARSRRAPRPSALRPPAPHASSR
ncbi:MAG: YhgE/Pip domain-containing protein [Candidatus Leucobacter sulfamidivorax]|nr:YhgE/Pip domain-containing protein [Candidatus Leucobacter sulfamidivorax]